MLSTLGKWLVGAWIALVIVLAFAWAPEMTRPNFTTGELEGMPSFRIVFFHVPTAWISVLAFGVSMIWSILVLRKPSRERDDMAMASAELGFLFCALALISGMIWSRIEWGAYWNWDPRQTSVLILLLIYGGYFTLRSSVSEPLRRGRLAAVYSIVAFVTVPFLMFIVPRIMFSLHPSPIIEAGQNKGSMDGKMQAVFFMSLAGFTGLYVWLLFLRANLERANRKVRAL